MTDKFKNKYRIGSSRLKNWDYGWNAAYFVTICTKNRICYFGDVSGGVMHLSNIGQVANDYWYEIPNHFPFVRLAAFVVMPNHVHGIVVIDKSGNVETPESGNVETPESGVSTPPLTTENRTDSNRNNRGGKNNNWKPEVLGVIINQYKRICTIQARKMNIDFAWQPRFYDHIIRNEKSYQNISRYIQTNPKNWSDDRLSGKNPRK